MRTFELMHIYWVANLLLVCALTVLFVIERMPLAIGWQTKPRLHYAALASVILLALAQSFIPRSSVLSPIAKVVSFPSRALAKSVVITVAAQLPSAKSSLSPGGLAAAGLLAGALLSLIRLIYEFRSLCQLRSRSFPLRKLLGVQIFVSEEVDVPFCFWWPGALTVVMPYALLGQPSFRIGVLHELQHHRQGDTQSVYVLALLKCVFVLNPAIHLWNRWLSTLQEFACDSSLVGHKKVEALAYATCMVQVAQNSINGKGESASAAARAFLTDRSTIHGRIKEMFKEEKTKTSYRGLSAAIVLIGGFLSATAFAARGNGVDHRFTISEAQELAGQQGSFPVAINDRVLKWLNIYAGTSEGRQRMSEALRRLPTYRPLIERKLNDYGLPEELLAIPLIESGYRNLPPSANAVHSAGLWQFIAGTAVNFGLQVDASVDERLDVTKETDAALRLLYANKLRFDDWGLSIMAYNSGETFVQKEITKLGSRDAWALIASGDGSEETNEYLPRLMAAILILRNPSIVN